MLLKPSICFIANARSMEYLTMLLMDISDDD